MWCYKHRSASQRYHRGVWRRARKSLHTITESSTAEADNLSKDIAALCRYGGLNTAADMGGAVVASGTLQLIELRRNTIGKEESDRNKPIAALVQGASLYLWCEWFHNCVA